ADIGGFYLTDTRDNKLQWRIPNGTVIPGGGHLLVWADNDGGQNGTGTNGDLHAGFNLAKGGEAIGLYAVIGTNVIEVDYVAFGEQTTDVSEGRYPDGALTISALSSITPRAPNAPPAGGGANQPPVLSAIPNAALLLGQTLSFTASATDPDSGQTLSYSLLPGAPTGATINSSGFFQWTPMAGQAPSSVPITVQVADNGSPVMTDSKTFTVVVALPPSATITRGGGSVSLTFPTLAGKHYQVQYKDNLNLPSWTPLPLPPSGD